MFLQNFCNKLCPFVGKGYARRALACLCIHVTCINKISFKMRESHGCVCYPNASNLSSQSVTAIPKWEMFKITWPLSVCFLTSSPVSYIWLKSCKKKIRFVKPVLDIVPVNDLPKNSFLQRCNQTVWLWKSERLIIKIKRCIICHLGERGFRPNFKIIDLNTIKFL